MKRSIYLLFLCATLQLDAALTITNKGASATNATSSTTTTITGTTMALGSLGVVAASYWNANGSTKAFTTCTDTQGNTWTLQLNAIYPGSGNGVEIAVYTAPITTAIGSGDTITVTITTATTGHLLRSWEVTGLNGVPVVAGVGATSDGLTSGQNSATVALTTGTINTNELVICWNAWRANAALTSSDSDTVNGSWNTVLSASTTAPVRLDAQTKIVNATGTQTWNMVLSAGSPAYNSGWIQIREAVLPSSGFNYWY